uniref:Uncharacterized protein n=1 Tax=Cajanus cajan TaxID=3821 RepID=A0A151RQI4_CAJCA|nr:hypothetical protein KK1_033668 [Cajanus cajan]
MVFQYSFTMTSNIMFLFCLVAVINNTVVPSSATRQLKASLDEKEAMSSTENRGHDQVDPINKNNNMESKEQNFDKNQFPPVFPFPRRPFPLPPYVPGLPWPIQPPPIGIPGIPSFPFPPVAIPGVPSLLTPPPA